MLGGRSKGPSQMLHSYFYWAAIGLLFIMVAFKAIEEKQYVVKFTHKEWVDRIGWLDFVKIRLGQTDLPAKEVTFINDSLISRFQREVASQINLQIQDSIKGKTK